MAQLEITIAYRNHFRYILVATGSTNTHFTIYLCTKLIEYIQCQQITEEQNTIKNLSPIKPKIKQQKIAKKDFL